MIKLPISRKALFRIFIFIISGIIILIPFLVSAPDGLSPSGLKALAIFITCVIWWVTNVVPLMITSLLAIVLLPLFGVDSSASVYAKFGNTAVFFVLGSFILASAFMRSGLSSRISLKFVKALGKNSVSFVIAFQYLATFMAFWISGHAVAALLLPMILEIGGAVLDQKDGRGYAKSLSLAVMWGAVVGSSATLLGGARGPLAIAILNKLTGSSITFSQWFLSTIPIVAGVSLVVTAILLKITPRTVDVTLGQKILEDKASSLGPISRKEKGILWIFIITLVLWSGFSTKLGLANIALLATIFLFVFNLVKWREVEEDVNWGIVLMYGGAIALGITLNETGVSEWIMRMNGNILGSSNLFLFSVIILSILFTEAMSNTAVVAFLMPVALSIALSMKITPEILALSVTLPAGMAFMLPMSTPAVAMVLSTGYVEMKDTIKYGLILNSTGMLLIYLAINFYWPMIYR